MCYSELSTASAGIKNRIDELLVARRVSSPDIGVLQGGSVSGTATRARSNVPQITSKIVLYELLSCKAALSSVMPSLCLTPELCTDVRLFA